MKRITHLFILLALITSSCKNKDTQTLLPHVSGAIGNVVVVMSAKNWKSDAGELIREELQQNIVALPQDEPLFDLVWMPHDAFTRVIRKQRNIIITKIGPDYKADVIYHKSLWAQSQIVVQIMAPSEEAFIELYSEKKKEITEQIQNAEIERLMDIYNKSQNTSIRKELKEKHNIDLIVPKGYRKNREADNFIWLDNRHNKIIEGIFIYYYPYTDSNTFSKDFLIAKRNEMLKKYVPAEKEGSYPTTYMGFSPKSYEYKLNGLTYTYELRGLWNVVDGFAMGGPFISISQFDVKRNRIVTVDGFVFAAGEEKRNYIKHLEAILYSLKFTEEE